MPWYRDSARRFGGGSVGYVCVRPRITRERALDPRRDCDGQVAQVPDRNIKALVSSIETNPSVALPTLSYKTIARRTHQPYRSLFPGSDTTSIQSASTTSKRAHKPNPKHHLEEAGSVRLVSTRDSKPRTAKPSPRQTTPSKQVFSVSITRPRPTTFHFSSDSSMAHNCRCLVYSCIL